MKQLRFGFLLLFALSLTLVGCNTGPHSDLEKVRVAEVTRSIFYAPQYVAITQGFFEEEGLDVELTTT